MHRQTNYEEPRFLHDKLLNLLTEKEVESIIENAKTPLSDILLLTVDENKKTQIFKKTSPLEN